MAATELNQEAQQEASIAGVTLTEPPAPEPTPEPPSLFSRLGTFLFGAPEPESTADAPAVAAEDPGPAPDFAPDASPDDGTDPAFFASQFASGRLDPDDVTGPAVSSRVSSSADLKTPAAKPTRRELAEQDPELRDRLASLRQELETRPSEVQDAFNAFLDEPADDRNEFFSPSTSPTGRDDNFDQAELGAFADAFHEKTKSTPLSTPEPVFVRVDPRTGNKIQTPQPKGPLADADDVQTAGKSGTAGTVTVTQEVPRSRLADQLSKNTEDQKFETDFLDLVLPKGRDFVASREAIVNEDKSGFFDTSLSTKQINNLKIRNRVHVGAGVEIFEGSRDGETVLIRVSQTSGLAIAEGKDAGDLSGEIPSNFFSNIQEDFFIDKEVSASRLHEFKSLNLQIETARREEAKRFQTVSSAQTSLNTLKRERQALDQESRVGSGSQDSLDLLKQRTAILQDAAKQLQQSHQESPDVADPQRQMAEAIQVRRIRDALTNIGKQQGLDQAAAERFAEDNINTVIASAESGNVPKVTQDGSIILSEDKDRVVALTGGRSAVVPKEGSLPDPTVVELPPVVKTPSKAVSGARSDA
ncbi:MAG: hypothetical protein QGH82_06835, partial [Candidatus Woesearchaeota archaeon]|nr:hypothetical protein [Candidatus Woesearchaeota archaeon]